MSALRVAIALSFLSLANTLSMAQTSVVAGRPAGFIKVELDAASQKLVSTPFEAFSSGVDSALQGQLKGSSTADGADRVATWDALSQGYRTAFKADGTGDSAKDGKFFLLGSDWTPSGLTVAPGTGFWLQNMQGYAQKAYLSGRVPLSGTAQVQFSPGMNLFSYPYAGSIMLNGTSLKGSGALGAASMEGGSDVVNKVGPDAAFWLKSLSGDAQDGKWLDESNAETAESLKAGRGYWLNRRGSGSFTWTEARPYADIFSAAARPEIAGITVDSAQDAAIVQISCAGVSGESVDILYMDMAEDGVFNPSGAWKLAAKALAANGVSSVLWADAGDEASGRAKPSQVFGRVYLVCRGDVDSDADGLSDGFEAFVSKTDASKADSDSDGLSDSYELNTSKTNPNKADSDADSFNDRDELDTYHTDPNSASSSPKILPAEWTSQDIGAVGFTGSALHYDGKFVVEGAGDVSSGIKDSLRLTSIPVCGDFELVARVASIGGYLKSGYVRVGLEVRGGTDDNAPYVMLAATPSKGLVYYIRNYEGSSHSASTIASTLPIPVWLKLVRTGDAFYGYTSTDGATWTQVWTNSVMMGTEAVAGLAVNAYDNKGLCKAEFDNVSIRRIAPAVTLSPASAGFGDTLAVSASCPLDGAEIRYAANGSDPDASSTLAENGSISLSASTELKARAFKQGYEPGSVSQGTYLKGAVPGLAALYYSGYQYPLTKLDTLTPSVVSTARQINYPTTSGIFGDSGLSDKLAASFRGSVYIPADGSYTLYLSADDYARLFIDGTERISGVACNEKSVTLTLTKGLHQLRADMTENTGSARLILQWAGPDFAKQAVPAGNLFSSDSDADGMGDDFETAFYGSLANDGSADSDADGTSDREEASTFFTKPSDSASKPLPATQQDATEASLVASYYQGYFTEMPKFEALTPYLVSTVPSLYWLASSIAVPPCTVSDYYGAAFTGSISIPCDGLYSFHIKGDNAARLLIDGTAIAASTGSEATGSVALKAGLHPIRVEFYEYNGNTLLQLLWTRPGCLKEVVPASALLHSAADLASAADTCDADGDGLSDSAEASLGTDKAKADSDSDGLSDYEEASVYHTDATKADSDSDGVSDYVECKMAFSNATAADFSGSSETASVSGRSATADSGSWAVEGDGIYALERNGWLEYSLPIAAKGTYMLTVSGTQHVQGASIKTFELELYIDGVSAGFRTLSAAYGATGKVEFFLPELSAGTHSARIQWSNVNAGTSLKVLSLSVVAMSGPDADANGVADWLDSRAASMSSVSVPAASKTSPLCVEGSNSRYVEQTSVSGFYTPDGEEPVAPVPFKGPDGTWFADIPLAPYAPTALTFSFQDNLASVSKETTWIPTDLVAENGSTIKVRVGDSLLLKAGEGSAGTVSFEIAGVQAAPAEGKAVLPYKFETQGEFDVSGSATTAAGESVSGAVKVKVVSASFSCDPVACTLQTQRQLKSQSLPEEAVLSCDRHLSVWESQVSTSVRDLSLYISQPQDAIMVARLSAGGPVLARCSVASISYSTSKEDGSFRVVETYSDGSSLIEGRVALSDVPADIKVVVKVATSGVTFDDGTITRTLTAADFDANGVARFYFLSSANARTSICHSFSLYQGATLIRSLE